METIQINMEETFPLLSKAPITEAVLEFRGEAGISWDEKDLTGRFKEQFSGYPEHRPRTEFQSHLEFRPGEQPSHDFENLGWAGVEARNDVERKVLRLLWNSFGFSHLAPYPGWEAFIECALHEWGKYQAIVQCKEITRIGLRVINRIDLSGENVDLDEILQVAPKEPQGLPLPFTGFLHRDHLAVPGYPYFIQCTRAIQPPKPSDPLNVELLIDVDVSLNGAISVNSSEIHQKLIEMRWLKNKVFFGTLTNGAIEKLT